MAGWSGRRGKPESGRTATLAALIGHGVVAARQMLDNQAANRRQIKEGMDWRIAVIPLLMFSLICQLSHLMLPSFSLFSGVSDTKRCA